jgi:hypothetical protein
MTSTPIGTVAHSGTDHPLPIVERTAGTFADKHDVEVSFTEGYASLELPYDGTLTSLRVGYGSHAGSAGLSINDLRVLYRLIGEAIGECERRTMEY